MLTLLLVAFVLALVIERRELLSRLNRAEERGDCSCKHYGEDYHPNDIAREGEW
jgi:hypothetical protein